MIESLNYAIKCPQCGNIHRKPPVEKLNSDVSKAYSDGKNENSMFNEKLLFGKCPECNCLFRVEAQQIKQTDYSSYSAIPYTTEDLTIYDYHTILEKNLFSGKEEELSLRKRILWSFNDRVRENRKIFASKDDIKIWAENINRMISMLDIHNDSQKILIAELYRYMGRMDICMSVINSVKKSEYDRIKELYEAECSKKNKMVFLISGINSTNDSSYDISETVVPVQEKSKKPGARKSEKISGVRVIAFDADDTLWANESFYLKTENLFCKLMSQYMPQKTIREELFITEMENMELYGYGAKAFILSMIETSLRISKNKVTSEIINEIIQSGKLLIDMPMELHDEVLNVLEKLRMRYRLVLATKGDILDQSRKIKKSGLGSHFEHIEIMTDKKEPDYVSLIKKLKIKPSEFLMVGNSLKSDVLPVLAMGSKAIHIPCKIIWLHETVDTENLPHFLTIQKLSDLMDVL